MREKSNFSWRNFFSSKLFSIGLFFLLILLSFAVSKIVSKKKNFDREIADLKSQIQRESKKKEELEKTLGDLENPETILKEARERFNLTREGEKVAIILPRFNSESVSPESQIQTQKKEPSNFKNWWNYFFHE
ncbi:MAG: septum formation initiator family protein [Parcubacteria group bacterium]|nr:septum formation initiator family protein [Parcubacteria group bacterium]